MVFAFVFSFFLFSFASFSYDVLNCSRPVQHLCIIRVQCSICWFYSILCIAIEPLPIGSETFVWCSVRWTTEYFVLVVKFFCFIFCSDFFSFQRNFHGLGNERIKKMLIIHCIRFETLLHFLFVFLFFIFYSPPPNIEHRNKQVW